MLDRFHNELGRLIGTPADPRLWADHFGCTVEGAKRLIQSLLAQGRAVERGGLLYRR